MDSKDWAHYLETTDGLSKPWLLIQWRLSLLQEQRPAFSPEVYTAELVNLHQTLMSLGDGWQGQEAIVFGTGAPPSGELRSGEA